MNVSKPSPLSGIKLRISFRIDTKRFQDCHLGVYRDHGCVTIVRDIYKRFDWRSV